MEKPEKWIRLSTFSFNKYNQWQALCSSLFALRCVSCDLSAQGGEQGEFTLWTSAIYAGPSLLARYQH